MNLQQKLTAWQKLQDEDMVAGWHMLIFLMKEAVNTGGSGKANLTLAMGPDEVWELNIENFVLFPDNMLKQLEKNKKQIQEYFKNINAQVDMSPPNPVVGRKALEKWLDKIGLKNWVVDLMDHLTTSIATGKAQFTRKGFSLQIPGPGFTEPVGNPKGRKKAKFMKTRRKKYFGDVGGDFRVYKDKLVAQGYYSFDDFYKAIKDCFGSEWQPKVFPDYGMDYKFRDEHERAFKQLKAQIDADKCGKPPIGTDDEKEPEKPEEPEKEAPTVDTEASGLFTSPRHASVRIVPKSDTLVYGEQDPLGIYGKEIPIVSVSLNKFIVEKFGYEGGWEEYKQKNKDDLTGKTIIQRKDGSRVEFDKPGEWVFQEGDKIISKPTLWPFHVYFAYEERNKLSKKSPDASKNIFIQTRQENLNFLKRFPDLMRETTYKFVFSSMIKTLKDRFNSELDINDIDNFKIEYEELTPEDRKEAQDKVIKTVKEIKGFIETKIKETFGDEWNDFINAQVVTKEGSEIANVLAKRYAIYGLHQSPPGAIYGFLEGELDADGRPRDASTGGVIRQMLLNPPEKLSSEGQRLVNHIRNKAGGNEEGKKEKGELQYLPKVGEKDVFTPAGLQVFLSKGIKINFEEEPYEWVGSSSRVGAPGEVPEGTRKLSLDLVSEGNHIMGIHSGDGILNTLRKLGAAPEVSFMGYVAFIPNKNLAFTQAENIFFKRIGIDTKPGIKFNPYKNSYNTSDGKRPDPYRDGSRVSLTPARIDNQEPEPVVQPQSQDSENDQPKNLAKKSVRRVVKKPKQDKKPEPLTKDIWWGPLMQFEGTENISLKRKKRGWAHKNTHKQLMSLSSAVSNKKGNLAGTKWFVEDISREINGKKYVSMGGHKSHSIGLDYDISIPTLDEKGASIWTNKESKSVPWGFVETKVDNINIPAVVDFFRHAYRSGVHKIFSDRKIINAVVSALKKYAEGPPVGPPDQANRFGEAYYKSIESFGKVTAEEINWFANNIKHLGGHHKHFHVRVAQDTTPTGKSVYIGGKRGRYVLKASRYYNPKAVARAKNLNESRASLKNYLSESLNNIIKDLKEGYSNELENKKIQ